MVRAEVGVRFAAGGIGDEAQRVGAGAGKLNEDNLVELGAVFGAEGLDELLHAVVEAADAGDVLDEAFGRGTDEPAEKETGDEAQQRDQAQDNGRGDDIPEDGRQMLQGVGQVTDKRWSDGSPDHADDQSQYPNRNRQRGDEQESREEGVAEGG